MQKSGIARSSLFLTTKIMSASSTVDETYQRIIESVELLSGSKDGYADLFLIHTPSGGANARKTMWQALERAHKEGRTKAIGVSNFGKGHIEELKTFATVWPPQVNQIEVRTCLSQLSLLGGC